MDNTLNAASAIAGLLSLTVQITLATQGYISRVASLSYAATSYLEELVCLKKLLADAQDALLFQSQSLSMPLPRELGEFKLRWSNSARGFVTHSEIERRSR
jgi:hypothetical protein